MPVAFVACEVIKYKKPVEEFLGYFRKIIFFLYIFFQTPPRNNSWALWRAGGLPKVSVLLEVSVSVRGRSCPKAEKRLLDILEGGEVPIPEGVQETPACGT